MTSDDAFSDFKPWTRTAASTAPQKPGVYAFRLVGSSIGRVLGQSDLVYIGCTENVPSLRRRVQEHWGNVRLERIRRKVGPLEVAWRTCRTLKEAVDLESDLLGKYKHEHIELPPLNDQISGRERQQAIDSLAELLRLKRDDVPRLVAFLQSKSAVKVTAPAV